MSIPHVAAGEYLSFVSLPSPVSQSHQLPPFTPDDQIKDGIIVISQS
jgi:hypothetical protein